MKLGGENTMNKETIKLTYPQIKDALAHHSERDEIIKFIDNKGLKDIDFLNIHEFFDMSHLKNPLDMNSATIIFLVYIVCIAVKLPYICNEKTDTEDKCTWKTIAVDIVFDTLIFMTVYYMDSCLTSDFGFKCQGISNTSILLFISLLIWKMYFLQHHKNYFVNDN